jgi:hypothetical protein
MKSGQKRANKKSQEKEHFFNIGFVVFCAKIFAFQYFS